MADAKLDTQIRREQIAETALGLVAAEGVRKLSIAAVARRVGLVPSGIYRHFASKDEILDAVLDLVEQRLGEIVESACQEGRDPIDRLRGVLRRHVRFIREGRAIPRMIFSDDFHSGHPERKGRVRDLLTGYLNRVAQLVREGQQSGAVRGDIDPNTTALMFFGMIVPAGILWHLTDGGIDVTQHAERAWNLFRAAIAPLESASVVNEPSQGAVP
jgi:AcrR family transcriptional regulator